MARQPKIHHAVPADALTVLKPEKLGRHYHKIPSYIKESASKHPQIFSDYFLRNFRINIELDTVRVLDQSENPANCIYQTEHGKIGFSIDRRLLAEALESYYGGTASTTPDMPPISTSEYRMQVRLGRSIVNMFARAVLAGSGFEELHEHENDYERIKWEYIAEFSFLCHSSGGRSSLFIYLDGALVDTLLARLTHPAPPRPGAGPKAGIKQLPVRLDCVIAAAEIPLAQALELEPGDILLLRPLDRYEVRINQHPLFRGAIFEESGALYLTSLESVSS